MQGDCLICSSGSPTKRLLQITDMSWGRLAHVPAVYRMKPMSCLRFAFSGDNWLLQVLMGQLFFESGDSRLSKYPIFPCVCVCVSVCLSVSFLESRSAAPSSLSPFASRAAAYGPQLPGTIL